MPLPDIAPPLGMTKRQLLELVFEGPRWKLQAAAAFQVSTRTVERLIYGEQRMTLRHYLVMARALKKQRQVTPLIVLQDERRARERGGRRIERIGRAEAVINPTLARLGYAA